MYILENVRYTTCMRSEKIGDVIMIAKDARVDIKTTQAAKATLEQAAYALGTTLSAFILDCAMPRARDVVAQSDLIHLSKKESERFVAAFVSRPISPPF